MASAGWSFGPAGNIGIEPRQFGARSDRLTAALRPSFPRPYLGNALGLVVGQQVVVELGRVEHACERFGRCGEGLGRKAVVAGHCWSPAGGFGGLFAGAVDRRLLGEALVWQEVGLNGVLSSTRLGCGGDAETDWSADCSGKQLLPLRGCDAQLYLQVQALAV